LHNASQGCPSLAQSKLILSDSPDPPSPSQEAKGTVQAEPMWAGIMSYSPTMLKSPKDNFSNSQIAAPHALCHRHLPH